VKIVSLGLGVVTKYSIVMWPLPLEGCTAYSPPSLLCLSVHPVHKSNPKIANATYTVCNTETANVPSFLNEGPYKLLT